MTDLPDVSRWPSALLGCLVDVMRPRHALYPGGTAIYLAVVLQLLDRGWRLHDPQKLRMTLEPDKPGPHF